MPGATTKKSPTLVTSTPSQSYEEQIRRRAYELYEARGREDGHDIEDWLRAESEIIDKTAKTAVA